MSSFGIFRIADSPVPERKRRLGRRCNFKRVALRDRDQDPQLHRARCHARHGILAPHDMRRRSGLRHDRGGISMTPDEGEIVRCLRPDRDRIGAGGRHAVGNSRQDVVGDINPLDRVECGSCIRRDDKCDRLADMADALSHKQRTRRHRRRRTIRPFERYGRREIRDAICGKVGRCVDREYARHLCRGRTFNR